MAEVEFVKLGHYALRCPSKDISMYVNMTNIVDDAKFRFFMENFDRITQSELENLILPKEAQLELLKEDDAVGYSPFEFEDDELIEELEDRKYFVFKPKNILEEAIFEALKDKYK